MIQRPINLDQLRLVRDGSGHSIYGPSGSSMWLNCPGSLIANLLAPNLGNEDSAYGTVAHELMEQWGKTGIKPVHRIGTSVSVDDDHWGHLVWIDEEMLDHCEACMDWITPIPRDYVLWETRVDFSRITPIPNQTGTADVIMVQLEQRRLVVIDWKFGKGVEVHAENNTQLMLYALGALWHMEEQHGIRFEEIEIRIAQPRRDNWDVWVTDRDNLMEFAGWAKARMALAWQIGAPRVPGNKQCSFCKVQSDCAAYAKINVEMTEGVFENLDAEHATSAEEMQQFKDRINSDDYKLLVADPGTLTTAELAKLYPYRLMAEKFWKAIRVNLMKRALGGEDLADYGWKIVEGRSIREFADEFDTVCGLTELGVDEGEIIVVKREMVSPTEAEKLLRKAGHRAKDVKNLLEGLIRKPKGKPTLARLSDKREPIGDINEGVFGNLESETTEEEDY